MEFVLFVVLTATLFLRPAELVPDLAGLPIYNYVMITCLIANANGITRLLQRDQLKRNPITVCVLGILVAAALSHLSRLDLWSAREYTVDLAKIIIFYFVMAAAVNTQKRLEQYLYWVAIFTVILSALAVGHYHEYFEIKALTTVRDWDVDKETGARIEIFRLQATGIFQDPNDLCMIVVVAMCICGMGLLDKFGGSKRFLWLAPLVFLGYTLTLTQSRGGFVAMLAAGLSLIYSRYGLSKAIMGLALFVPVAGVLFAGRQTDISGALSGGTGHSRVELWSEGLQELRASPIFGIGFRQYAEEVGLVAHNSYVHSLVELGILGGATFMGAFWLAARIMWNLGAQRQWMTRLTGSSRLAYMQPFLIAIMAGYMTSMLALSRSYAIPTYLILGLFTAYQNVAAKKGIQARVPLDGREIVRIYVVSVLYLALTYFYIRISYR